MRGALALAGIALALGTFAGCKPRPPAGKTAPKAPETIPQGTIGLVTLAKGEKDVVFWLPDVRHVPGAGYGQSNLTAPVDGGLVLLFDDKGPLGIVETERLTYTFHCENDGGMTYRPAMRVPIASLTRKPSARKDLADVVGFAVVGAPAPPGNLNVSGARLSADADGDKKPDAVLFTQPSEAGCGNGGAERDFAVGVRGPKGEALIDCCGP